MHRTSTKKVRKICTGCRKVIYRRTHALHRTKRKCMGCLANERMHDVSGATYPNARVAEKVS